MSAFKSLFFLKLFVYIFAGFFPVFFSFLFVFCFFFIVLQFVKCFLLGWQDRFICFILGQAEVKKQKLHLQYNL